MNNHSFKNLKNSNYIICKHLQVGKKKADSFSASN
jgi:hypothetical protein